MLGAPSSEKKLPIVSVIDARPFAPIKAINPAPTDASPGPKPTSLSTSSSVNFINPSDVFNSIAFNPLPSAPRAPARSVTPASPAKKPPSATPNNGRLVNAAAPTVDPIATNAPSASNDVLSNAL